MGKALFSPSRSQARNRQAADHRPPLGPAIVSGGCAVAVALITGLFNWINRPAPSAAPTVVRTATESSGSAAREIRTAANAPDAPPTLAIAPRPAPIYSLNFAAFQGVVRDTTLAAEVRQQAIQRVVGNAVLWQGYVAKVVANDPAERGLIGTVVLVEDQLLTTQTLLPYAAYCRFTNDPEGQLGRLRPGDAITIRGDCTRHSALGTEIENCGIAAGPG